MFKSIIRHQSRQKMKNGREIFLNRENNEKSTISMKKSVISRSEMIMAESVNYRHYSSRISEEIFIEEKINHGVKEKWRKWKSAVIGVWRRNQNVNQHGAIKRNREERASAYHHQAKRVKINQKRRKSKREKAKSIEATPAKHGENENGVIPLTYINRTNREITRRRRRAHDHTVENATKWPRNGEGKSKSKKENV